MMEHKGITISCPKCGKSHTYRIAVEQVEIMAKYRTTLFTILFGLLSLPFQFLAKKNDEPTTYTFTRLFTCPAKGVDFEAVFELSSSSYPIRKVEVLKSISENNEQ